MKQLTVINYFCLLFCVVFVHQFRYQVLRVTPESENDLKVLRNLEFSELGEEVGTML